MDTAAFLQAIPSLFVGGDVAEGELVDDRFAAVAADTSGFTTPTVLAILHLAATLLPADEAYLEVGTFQGRSLCGTMHGLSSGHFYGVENFSEFGMMGAEARQALTANLSRWTDDGLLTLLEGDSFEVLSRPELIQQPVGVYFYDGAHTLLTHYLALGVAEPLLADHALVLIDDAGWPLVRRATERYIRERPWWSVLTEFRPLGDDDARWANGLMALEFRRPASSEASQRDVVWRSSLYQQVERPLTSRAWRFVHEHPVVVPALKKLVPTRGRRVDPRA